MAAEAAVEAHGAHEWMPYAGSHGMRRTAWDVRHGTCGMGRAVREACTARNAGHDRREGRGASGTTERDLTGVLMYEMVRARLRALVGRMRRDTGMVTSEYAMGIIAAVAFAVLLYEVVTSGQVKTELQNIVKRALSARM
ncbi:hypothetical protein GCM10023336_28760 [Streptomyces similanensis]|uniref:DUF4244 domain-containing protein n=2 Tax=Streptomyces similanensis TaxID=1274988 RepID=A0ABP9KD43_9ACTN